MRMVLDANILIRAVLGTGRAFADAAGSKLDCLIVDAQVHEALGVLTGRLGYSDRAARAVLEPALAQIGLIDADALDVGEAAARRRLEGGGQGDWPVLAAAQMLEGHIWSDDRDFFGVGVPVWSTRNLPMAIEQSVAVSH